MTFKKTLKRKEVKNKDKSHKSLFLASVYPIFEMRQSHSWDSASFRTLVFFAQRLRNW